jgi:hypothetical protein
VSALCLISHHPSHLTRSPAILAEKSNQKCIAKQVCKQKHQAVSEIKIRRSGDKNHHEKMEGSAKIEAHETTKHLERSKEARSIKLIIVIKKTKSQKNNKQRSRVV